MKILKITTHWTPEEADAIYQFLDNYKEALWQSYGEDIVQMHKTIHDQQQASHIAFDHLDDELPVKPLV